MKIYVLLHFYSINIKINKLIGEKKKKKLKINIYL